MDLVVHVAGAGTSELRGGSDLAQIFDSGDGVVVAALVAGVVLAVGGPIQE